MKLKQTESALYDGKIYPCGTALPKGHDVNKVKVISTIRKTKSIKSEAKKNISKKVS